HARDPFVGISRRSICHDNEIEGSVSLSSLISCRTRTIGLGVCSHFKAAPTTRSETSRQLESAGASAYAFPRDLDAEGPVNGYARQRPLMHMVSRGHQFKRVSRHSFRTSVWPQLRSPKKARNASSWRVR